MSFKAVVLYVALALGSAELAEATEVFVSTLDPTISGRAGILIVDTTTGDQRPFSIGGLFIEPNSVARGSNGDLYVANEVNVLRIDKNTGAQSVLSTGGFLAQPVAGIAVGLGDSIYASYCCGGAGTGVVKLDVVTGAQSLLTSGGLLVAAFRLTTTADGSLYAVDPDAFGGSGGLIAIDTLTGIQRAVSQGGMFVNPWDAEIGPDGFAYVLDVGLRAVVRVDIDTGEQTLLSSLGLITASVSGLGFDENGTILLADAGTAGGSLLAVDRFSGAQSIVSTGQFFVYPYDVVASVPSAVPEPPTACMLIMGLIAVTRLRQLAKAADSSRNAASDA